jgi:hypothetical protein
MAGATCSGWYSALTWRFAVWWRMLSARASCPGKLTATSFSMPVSAKMSLTRDPPSGAGSIGST